MVNADERSSPNTSSEHASAEAYIASCYNGTEQVRFFAAVVPEGKLRQVQWEVFFAHLMERPDRATPEQASTGSRLFVCTFPHKYSFLS